MTTEEQNFEQLPLARAASPDAMLVGQYRLYTDQRNFTRVQAESAVSALELSGLLNIFKIEREALHKSTLIMPNFAHVHAAPPASAS